MITGPAADLDDFERRARCSAERDALKPDGEASLFLSAFVPEPLAVHFGSEADGSYHWCMSHWGIRHELDDETSVTREPHRLIYEFTSAWGPPGGWVALTAREYPTLAFALHCLEAGNGVYGSIVCADGATVQQVAHSEREAVMLHGALHFDWYPSDDEEEQEDEDVDRVEDTESLAEAEPETEAAMAARLGVIRDVEPVVVVHASEMEALRAAPTPDAVHAVLAAWRDGNRVPLHVAAITIARHAAVLDAALVQFCLADPVALRVLADSPALTPDLAPLVTPAVVQTLAAIEPVARDEDPLATEVEAACGTQVGRGVLDMLAALRQQQRLLRGDATEAERTALIVDDATIAGVRLRERGHFPSTDPAYATLRAAVDGVEGGMACDAIVEVLTAAADTPPDVFDRCIAACARTRTPGALAHVVLNPAADPARLVAAIHAGATPAVVRRLLATRGAAEIELREGILRTLGTSSEVMFDLLRFASTDEFPRIIETLVQEPHTLVRALTGANPMQLAVTSPVVLEGLFESRSQEIREAALDLLPRMGAALGLAPIAPPADGQPDAQTAPRTDSRTGRPLHRRPRR